MTGDGEDQPAEYGLVMPFVVCQSQGGPYEDAAFVAGYEAACVGFTLDVLQRVGGSFERWVSPSLVPQLDLIAMDHGYKTTAEPWDEHPDEYVRIRFEPAP
jgi:hypothetical protein